MKYILLILVMFGVSFDAQAREIKPFNMIHFPEISIDYPLNLGSFGTLEGAKVALEKAQADLAIFAHRNPSVFGGVDAKAVYINTCSGRVCGEIRLVAGKFVDPKAAFERCYAARDQGNRCEVLEMRNSKSYNSDLFHAVKHDVPEWFR
jgi:hypothetical protein